MYRVIMDNDTVVEAATPTALGTALGKVIPEDPRNDVVVTYVLSAPTSRRMLEED